MRWLSYGLSMRLSFLNSIIDDIKHYIKYPLHLQKRYTNIIDYSNQSVSRFYAIKLEFKTEKDIFEFLYNERKITHNKLMELKPQRKFVKDKLSKIPKKKQKFKL